MNNDGEKWQWVDEDPFEKLLGRPKSAVEADSPALLPEFAPRRAAIVAASVDANPVDSYSARFAAEAKDSAAAFDLAVSLEKVEKWDAAADSFRRTLEIEPGRVDALIGLGACLLHLDHADEALSCFEECLFSNLDRERVLLGKAVALQELKRYEEADLAYRELLQITPNASEPLGNLIALSVVRQDATALGEYSRRLLRVDPYSKAALQGLATLALWNGDHAAAINYCMRVLEVDPVSYEGWFNLGFAKQHRHPAEQAMRSIA